MSVIAIRANEVVPVGGTPSGKQPAYLTFALAASSLSSPRTFLPRLSRTSGGLSFFPLPFSTSQPSTRGRDGVLLAEDHRSERTTRKGWEGEDGHVALARWKLKRPRPIVPRPISFPTPIKSPLSAPSGQFAEHVSARCG